MLPEVPIGSDWSGLGRIASDREEQESGGGTEGVTGGDRVTGGL